MSYSEEERREIEQALHQAVNDDVLGVVQFASIAWTEFSLIAVDDEYPDRLYVYEIDLARYEELIRAHTRSGATRPMRLAIEDSLKEIVVTHDAARALLGPMVTLLGVVDGLATLDA